MFVALASLRGQTVNIHVFFCQYEAAKSRELGKCSIMACVKNIK